MMLLQAVSRTKRLVESSRNVEMNEIDEAAKAGERKRVRVVRYHSCLGRSLHMRQSSAEIFKCISVAQVKNCC